MPSIVICASGFTPRMIDWFEVWLWNAIVARFGVTLNVREIKPFEMTSWSGLLPWYTAALYCVLSRSQSFCDSRFWVGCIW